MLAEADEGHTVTTNAVHSPAVPSVADIRETVKDVQGFYEQAWSKLVYAFTFAVAIFGLVGILVPIWLERDRKTAFGEERRDILRELERSHDRVVEDSVARVKKAEDDLKARIATSEQETLRAINEQASDSYSLSAAMFIDEISAV